MNRDVRIPRAFLELRVELFVGVRRLAPEFTLRMFPVSSEVPRTPQNTTDSIQVKFFALRKTP